MLLIEREAVMKTFEYTIKDTAGIHARPAGLLVKESKKFTSVCSIKVGNKECELGKLMALMALGVTKGDKVTVKANGDDEDTAIEALEKFFQMNL
jgi:phosphocarrier protein